VSTVLTWATVTAALRLAIPVTLAALGALVNERAGVLNLGVEGVMTVGALAGYLANDASGSPWVGLVAGTAAGAAAGALLALVVVTAKANQVVAGLALTLLGVSMSTWVFQRFYDIGDSPPRVATLGLPALLVVVAVARTRWIATVAGAALMGLGGAALVCGPLGLFISNVVSGRGWVALALVVFARWRPLPCAFGALLFGLCDAVQLRLQGTATAVPYEVFLALPYLAALLAVTLRSSAAPGPLRAHRAHRPRRAPAALGTPHTR
jgi:simple sugar transport system permease protein